MTETGIYHFIVCTDAEQIALLEPLGVAHNAVERLDVKGHDVLVTGCGPVGILAQSMAKALGAKRLVCNLFAYSLGVWS